MKISELIKSNGGIFGDEYIEEAPVGMYLIHDLPYFLDKNDYNTEEKIKDLICKRQHVYLSPKTIEFILNKFPLFFEDIEIHQKENDYALQEGLKILYSWNLASAVPSFESFMKSEIENTELADLAKYEINYKYSN